MMQFNMLVLPHTVTVGHSISLLHTVCIYYYIYTFVLLNTLKSLNISETQPVFCNFLTPKRKTNKYRHKIHQLHQQNYLQAP